MDRPRGHQSRWPVLTREAWPHTSLDLQRVSTLPPSFSSPIEKQGLIKGCEGWWVGWWQESIRRGENSWVLKFLHIHPGIRESNSHSAHTNPAPFDTPGMLKFFFFITNLGNYHSGHGAKNRDRDPGRYAVTARVAEAVLCFVLLKPELPTNSSLTSLQQPIFGDYNACQLVYCVPSGLPNIPMSVVKCWDVCIA